jgi:hypothetical protein
MYELMNYVTEAGSITSFSAVLGYVSMSEEANIKLVGLVGKHSILYNWKDPGCTRKKKNDLEWENIKQGLTFRHRNLTFKF